MHIPLCVTTDDEQQTVNDLKSDFRSDTFVKNSDVGEIRIERGILDAQGNFQFQDLVELIAIPLPPPPTP